MKFVEVQVHDKASFQDIVDYAYSYLLLLFLVYEHHALLINSTHIMHLPSLEYYLQMKVLAV